MQDNLPNDDQRQPVDEVVELVPTAVRVGIYDSYGGGCILRFALPESEPVQVGLQAELAFDLTDHVGPAARKFEHIVSSATDTFDEPQDVTRDAFLYGPVEHSHGGWSLFTFPDHVEWTVKLQSGGRILFNLSPMVLRQMFEQLEYATKQEMLLDLRPFIGMTWPQMMRAFDKLPGNPIADRIRAFEFSTALFRRHSSSLIELLKAGSGELSVEQMRWDRRFAIEDSMGEAAFRLFDFLAALEALTDHTRVLYRELYEAKAAIPTYQDEVDRRFKNNGTALLFKHMRQLIVHRGILGPGHTIKVMSRVGTFTLKRKALLAASDKWPAQAKALLLSSTEDFDLLELVKSHTQVVEDFQQWFEDQRSMVHWKEFRRAELMRRAVLGRRGLLELPAVLTLAKRPNISRQELVGAVSQFLTAKELYDLREFEGDLPTWISSAIEAAVTRYPLSEELRRELGSAARRAS